MKRLIPVILIFGLLLCGCSGEEEAPASIATTQATTEATEATTLPTEVTEPATEDTTPTEPATLYRNPFNGAPLSEPFTGRAVTFTIGNTDEARPQYGISQADIFCEITVEGGLTRCMPVFSDLSNVGPIGSIRSARTYFISISQAFDAIFLHSGASIYAANLFNSNPVTHVNADPAIFYRDQARAAAGYAYEHRHFVNGTKTYEYLTENYDLTSPPDSNYGLGFVDEQDLQGESAATIRVNFGDGYAKATKFTYDEAAGNYTTTLFNQSMKEEPWIDAANNEVLRFENILVLYEKRTGVPGATAGNVYHELVGSNTGYYACGGKWVSITWHRENEFEPFSFALEDGTPLNMIPGKTYIGFVPTGSPINFE